MPITVYRPCDNEKMTFKDQRAALLYKRLHTKQCEFCKLHTEANQTEFHHNLKTGSHPIKRKEIYDKFLKTQREGCAIVAPK